MTISERVKLKQERRRAKRIEDAARLVVQFDAGTNIMGEKLCPVCSEPLPDNGIGTKFTHGDGCPFPELVNALS